MPPRSAPELESEDVELARAVSDWKARTGRAFPKWSEMRTILRGLGYAKCEEAGPRANPGRYSLGLALGIGLLLAAACGGRRPCA